MFECLTVDVVVKKQFVLYCLLNDDQASVCVYRIQSVGEQPKYLTGRHSVHCTKGNKWQS